MVKILRGVVPLLLCFCVICSLCGVGFAAPSNPYQVGGDTSISGGGGGDGTYIVLPDDFIIQSAGYDDFMAIDPYSLAPVTPGNTSGLKAVLLSILGSYDPICAEATMYIPIWRTAAYRVCALSRWTCSPPSGLSRTAPFSWTRLACPWTTAISRISRPASGTSSSTCGR